MLFISTSHPHAIYAISTCHPIQRRTTPTVIHNTHACLHASSHLQYISDHPINHLISSVTSCIYTHLIAHHMLPCIITQIGNFGRLHHHLNMHHHIRQPSRIIIDIMFYHLPHCMYNHSTVIPLRHLLHRIWLRQLPTHRLRLQLERRSPTPSCSEATATLGSTPQHGNTHMGVVTAWFKFTSQFQY